MGLGSFLNKCCAADQLLRLSMRIFCTLQSPLCWSTSKRKAVFSHASSMKPITSSSDRSFLSLSDSCLNDSHRHKTRFQDALQHSFKALAASFICLFLYNTTAML
uniref:Putative ovule protein n=1 Tax=Solanum chacoense TaxID=4108 RepID=A0A0V0GY52_SOLCH